MAKEDRVQFVAIALSPIAHAVGMVSDLVASIGFYSGLTASAFGLVTGVDKWTCQLEQQTRR
ncbi:hypothetical protein JL101_030065 (plasmid) [Skermanella rosea]|uniref:hypothetical protein n=1 Tax=Skermanella rosea TaxID=1817965 RepID=UPI001933A1AC|nr:hypothetical protein [Skermanella rosea]UEM06743.1 hypothetical protein JL101_030065 [Skermanella rosea]